VQRLDPTEPLETCKLTFSTPINSHSELPGANTVAVTVESNCVNDSNFENERNIRLLLQTLSKTFAEPFAVVDVHSGDVVRSSYGGLSCDHFGRIELLAEVSRRGKPEIVEDVAPLSLLAIPLGPLDDGCMLVAVGVFVQHSVTRQDEVAAAARTLGTDAGRTFEWARQRDTWSSRTLLRMASLVLENLTQKKQLLYLKTEVHEAVAHARDTSVELGLLHRLAEQLQLSKSAPQLWQTTLSWLAEKLPAQSLAIVFNPQLEHELELPSDILIHGECPVTPAELKNLMQSLGSVAQQRTVVLNRPETSLPTWQLPTLREVASVPIFNGDNPLAWLLALNHQGTAAADINQFSSVETRLLSSIATMLGIHSSNLRLYREQADLFASSVKALTSAIDAKDRYTAGHSDRVAQVSVMLAEELGLEKADLETIYLAGLLHDIGKIGINDHVLNKPGELTKDEHEQIKLHPQLGYDILQGVQQLDEILPIVLHHHEAWNGRGYPYGLEGTDTPQMARIMAVADSFDAMSSDRPYRKGMSDEQLDAIIRDGAGSQWDSQVVEAFFEIREDIRTVSDKSRSGLSLTKSSSV